jgi:hypothetical protein
LKFFSLINGDTFMKTGSSLFVISIFILILYSTTNNAQWAQIGLPNVVVTSLAVSQDSTICFAGTSNSGIYSSTDQGSTWKRSDDGSINFSVNAINTEARRNNGFIAGTNNGMYVSSDRGNTWFNPNLPGLRNTHINTVCWDSKNGLILGTNGGVFYLPDNTSNFTQLTSGISDSTILAVCYDYPNSGYVWCGTSNGLYVSTNYGSSWSKRTNVVSPVHCIILNGTMMMAGSENGIYETGMNGPRSNVTGPFSANFSESWYQSMTMGPLSNPTPVFIGSQGKGLVYYSYNAGAHCDDKSTGLKANGSVNALVYVGQYLIAGTNNGLWQRKISELTGVETNNSLLPSSYCLNQNYPNPFNPTTTISYQLPAYSHVKLNVYDILGREVATIVNNNQPAGNYKVEFNADKLVSGVYFYQLKSGNFSQTKKFILMK